MGRKETDKQINFSMGEDLYNQIREAASERGLSVAAFLKAAAQDAVLDDLKAAVPDQSSNIDSFKSKLGELSDLYKIALTQAADSYEIASSKVKEELKALQGLTSMTQQQAEQISQLRGENETLRNEIGSLKAQIEDQSKIKQALDASEKENSSLKSQLADSDKKLYEEKVNHAAELKALQDENYEKIIRIFKETKS